MTPRKILAPQILATFDPKVGPKSIHLAENTKPQITYTIKAEVDDQPIRGAFASGDEAQDKETEDEIIRKVEAGNVWAWAFVTVTAECEGFKGKDTLGGCSYTDEADFRKDGYFEDMKRAALADLLTTLGNLIATGKVAAQTLKALKGMGS